MTGESAGQRDRLRLENEALRREVAELRNERDRLERTCRRADPQRSEVARDPNGGPETDAGDIIAPFSHFEDLVEFLPDAAFVLDRDKRVVAWNRACEELTGVKREALLGRGDHAYSEAFWGTRCSMLIDLLDSSAQPDEEARYKYVKRRGDMIFAESFIPHLRGGRGAHLWGEAKPLLDQQGRRCGAVEVVRDVTEQREMEQALRENEVKYRTLFENARDAILVLRGDRIVDCNVVAETLFGCVRERMLGTTPQAFSPELQPDGQHSREKALQQIERALAEGAQTFEWEHCREDRTPFTAEVTLSRLELGGDTLLQAIVRDVTVRKQIEEALRASERQLSLVLNNVSDIIFAIAVDPGGFRFSWVNRRFLEVTGLQERQIVGALAHDVIPPPAHALVFGKYEEAIRTGRPVHWEEESVYPGGKKVGAVTVVPVHDAHGTCLQLVGMVHDITERKAAEEKIGKLNEELLREAEVLEERVRVRTAQLAERNQELKDFAYTVSHDLKAPLRGIAGYANELDRKHRAGLGDRAVFCVQQIISAATHLDQLIEDLLQYSRLDSETPSLTEVDLRALVGIILRDRELLVKDLHAEVILDIPDGAELRTWERGLAQVLSNLIDNAIKYSRKSSPPRVRIAAAPIAGGWRLTVGDNGIGFDMKYHDRIFRLFNRLVRMEEYEGTGAGLAIAKKVLDKEKGRIWAESMPGQGATFFVEIPTPQDSQQEKTPS